VVETRRMNVTAYLAIAWIVSDVLPVEAPAVVEGDETRAPVPHRSHAISTDRNS
jgi:hypothetical protein